MHSGPPPDATAQEQANHAAAADPIFGRRSSVLQRWLFAPIIALFVAVFSMFVLANLQDVYLSRATYFLDAPTLAVFVGTTAYGVGYLFKHWLRVNPWVGVGLGLLLAVGIGFAYYLGLKGTGNSDQRASAATPDAATVLAPALQSDPAVAAFARFGPQVSSQLQGTLLAKLQQGQLTDEATASKATSAA